MSEGLFELMSDSDTAASGLLNDKNVHSVYKLILNLSTPKNVKNLTIFDPETAVSDSLHMDREFLCRILNRLVAEKAVINIPYFEHSGNEAGFSVHSAFIADPGHGRRAESLYADLTEQSARVCDMYLSSRSLPDRQTLRSILRKERSSGNFFLDLRRVLDQYAAPVPFKPEIINLFIKDVNDYLKRKAVLVPGLGLIPQKPEYVQFVFETAADYMVEELIPVFCVEPECIRKVRLADIEETLYYTEADAKQTVKFVSMKADALGQAISETETQNTLKDSAVCTLDVIHSLADKTESVYEDQARARIESLALQFRNSVLNHGGSWRQAVRFVTHAEMLEMNKDVWELIQKDDSLFFSIWERPGGRVYIFTPADYEVFWLIIPGMLSEIHGSDWRIVALKNHIETHESRMRPLFAQREFIELYGKLLRRAYIEYMPWFYRLIINIGFPFLHDIFFAAAKDKIRHEQLLFGRKNDLRLRAIVAELQEKKNARISRMIEQTMYNAVIAQLDEWYFRKNMIPLVIDIDAALPELETSQLEKIIKKYNIITVPFPGSGRPELSVIMYPADQNWRSKLNKIKKLVMVLLEQDKRKPAGEKKESDAFSFSQTDRARRIFTYLQKKSEYQSSGSRSPLTEDPYEVLSRQIQKGLEPEKRG